MRRQPMILYSYSIGGKNQERSRFVKREKSIPKLYMSLDSKRKGIMLHEEDFIGKFTSI
jgi:hypothetical protein